MAKKLKIKLPKRIAGVKIPKTVRKGPIGEFLNSGAGQVVIAQALVGAAAAFTAGKSEGKVGDFVRHPLFQSRHAARKLAKVGSDESERLLFALREAMRAFQAAMESGPSREGEWSEEGAGTQELEVTAKKKQRNAPLTPH